MTAVADDEVLLPTIWTPGIFIGAVDFSADSGLVVSLTLCGGFFDGEGPGEPPSVVTHLFCANSVGLVYLAAFAQNNYGFIEFTHLWNPRFLPSRPQ